MPKAYSGKSLPLGNEKSRTNWEVVFIDNGYEGSLGMLK
jgi:hypothetical protein